jgi:hypothetical protein
MDSFATGRLVAPKAIVCYVIRPGLGSLLPPVTSAPPRILRPRALAGLHALSSGARSGATTPQHQRLPLRSRARVSCTAAQLLSGRVRLRRAAEEPPGRNFQ